MSNIVHLDGGIKYEQKSGSDNYRHPGETNDCTVRAVSAAFDVPYKDAHRYLKEFHGRKNGKGIRFVDRLGKGTQMIFWKTVTYFPRPGKTIKSFIKDNPKGTFMVLIPKHIFTVKDGVMIDIGPNRLGARVKEYYKIG